MAKKCKKHPENSVQIDLSSPFSLYFVTIIYLTIIS